MDDLGYPQVTELWYKWPIEVVDKKPIKSGRIFHSKLRIRLPKGNILQGFVDFQLVGLEEQPHITERYYPQGGFSPEDPNIIYDPTLVVSPLKSLK